MDSVIQSIDDDEGRRMLSRLKLAERFPVFGRCSSLPLPLHGSHRGGRHWGRENSLDTCRRAVDLAQTDILEVDLWRSADDRLVLNHDGIVNGVSVKQATLDQLQRLDPELITVDRLLGASSLVSPPPPPPSGFECEASLLSSSEEFLPRPSLLFFFDMKDAEAIPLTITLIDARRLHDRVIFGAVDPSINERLRQLKPASIPLCADVETMKTLVHDYLHGRLTDEYPYQHDILGLFLERHTRPLLTKDFLDRIHRAGKPLALVGSLLDHVDVQNEMIQLGVDILFTDRPDVLRQTLHSLSDRTDSS